ncbi:MAG: ABC transporter ATP-binding protein [Caldilineaceae bacterium]|nr:ABC transporter ATP-binding protein [Caldilineaceae bacterium]
MTKLLELNNVTKVFKGGTVALDDISFSVDSDSPSVITVAGESGSGKSTLGLITLGFLEPSQGVVHYKGQDLTSLNSKERVTLRREVQAIFQDPFAVYNPFYKVDHLFDEAVKNFGLASNRADARRMIEQSLESVGLRPDETLGRFPHQLSGGQRQRLVVARALLLQPRLLVADEPVSMVDASLRATILKSLRKLNEEFKITVLYITHDLTTAYHISDYIIILYQGSIMEAGDVDAVIRDPKHPYTQLLIDSIPWPDLQRQWGQQEIIIPDGTEKIGQGCKFANRCPHVMEICREARPPLYQPDGVHRVAACYLYEKSPTLPKNDVGQLFSNGAKPETFKLAAD